MLKLQLFSGSISQAKEVKAVWLKVLALSDSIVPLAVQCHITGDFFFFFVTLNTSVLGCLRVFFFSLLGQKRCCEKKRGFPEERSFIGQNRAVSGCCATHGQEGCKRRHRKAKSRC